VFNADGTPHASNSRSRLRRCAERYAAHEAWFGIEQEYVLFKDGRPLGWPESGYPEPQGGYYTGVGAGRVAGRDIVEAHTAACLSARLGICGTNSEVMLGQWEFQVGPLGPLEVADELWIARWLLRRIAEDRDVSVSLDPKPVEGDWNGSGAHTNFSTRATRSEGGMRAIEAACERLRAFHDQHMRVYGAGNERRLTGLHETCSIREFKYGVSHRGASVRIPMATSHAGRGYFEDRRPAANMDPYQVAAALLETVCGEGFQP
jgi:glutamine synthetase